MTPNPLIFGAFVPIYGTLVTSAKPKLGVLVASDDVGIRLGTTAGAPDQAPRVNR